MALKLDIRKAYDCVEWIFLKKNLLRMDSPTRFVDMIFTYIFMVSYSFLLNGAQSFIFSQWCTFEWF